MVPAGDELHEGGLAVEGLAVVVTAVAGRAPAVGRVTTVVVSGGAVVHILGVGITIVARFVSTSIAGVTVPSITAIVTSTPTITAAVLATTIHPRSNGHAPCGSSNGSAHLLEGSRRLIVRAGKPAFRLHAAVVDQGPREVRNCLE